jgi:ABC-2 type transport system ATP-binding protein
MITEIKNIYKKIEDKEIISDINFTLNEKEVVALVGPNGAGKTTLLKLIVSLLKPERGTIKICNFDIQKNREQALNHLAYMQDASALYSDLTGYEHLKFIATSKSIPVGEVKKIIENLQINEYINSKVRKYSLGMKQHLLLAIAILGKPKLLLMDEPFNGLDPSSSLLLRKVIMDLREQGTTILFSSHILAEVDKVADRLLFIRDGKIVMERSNHRLKLNENTTYLLKVTQPKEVMSILTNESTILEVIELNSGELQISLAESDLSKILKKLSVNDIYIKDIVKVEHHSEQIYHSIYGEKNE